MFLRFDEYSIRPFRLGDEPALVQHANNRNIWINLRDLFPHPYTMEHAIEWVRRTSTDQPVTQFAIDVEGYAIGGIGIVLQQDVYCRSAEIGYWLSEDFWGRGITTDAVKAITEWAFSRFNLCRIYAGIFEWNEASMHVLKKAGYTQEARLYKSVTKDGKTIDELIYAIVRSEDRKTERKSERTRERQRTGKNRT